MYMIEKWSAKKDKWLKIQAFVNEISAEIEFNKLSMNRQGWHIRLSVIRTLREKKGKETGITSDEHCHREDPVTPHAVLLAWQLLLQDGNSAGGGPVG